MNKPCPPRLRSAGVRHCMAHPSGKERPTIEYYLWLFVARRVSSREQGNKVSAEIGVVTVVARKNKGINAVNRMGYSLFEELVS